MILGQGNRLLEVGRGTMTSCPQAFQFHLPPPNSTFWAFLIGSCTEMLRNKMEPGDQQGLGPWGRLGAPSRESCLPVAGIGDSLLWWELVSEQASQSS